MKLALPFFATRDRVIGAVLVIGCGIVQAAALAIMAFATRDAFAALHAGAPLMYRTLLELALSGALTSACLYLSSRQAESLGQSYAISLRHALYEKIAKLPKSRHERRRTGALALRFVGDLSAARLWFGKGLPDVITALIVFPGAVTILFVLDVTLAAAGLVPLGVAIVFMIAVAIHLEKRHRCLRSRRASIAIDMIERIAIAPELDLIGRTKKEMRNLSEKGAALKADAVARRGRTAGLQSILQLGVAFAGLSILWFASRHGVAPSTAAASLSVLALVTLPVQNFGGAWDRYCAWRVASEKMHRLFEEPSITRRSKPTGEPVSVSLAGTATFKAEAGSVARLCGPDAETLARIIAGLDQDAGVVLTFGEEQLPPKVAFIGDTHIGLQGSLRRSATLSVRKRPSDKTIEAVLEAFGLDYLLAAHAGLDQRICENGKGLSAAQTLRLDLARCVLGESDVIVISSQRWEADTQQEVLLEILQNLSAATIVLAESADVTHALSYIQV